jgi:hypothetical protein
MGEVEGLEALMFGTSGHCGSTQRWKPLGVRLSSRSFRFIVPPVARRAVANGAGDQTGSVRAFLK